MKKLCAIVASLMLCVGALGCIGAPVVPPLGLLYTDLESPLGLGGNVGGRRGEATVVSILGLVSTGNASIRAAAQNGRITEVKATDYEFYNVLGIYQRYTTVVYGD